MEMGGKKNKDCIEKQSKRSVMSTKRFEYKEVRILVRNENGLFN